MTTPLFRILSIDGGGMRGILPGQILVTLEEILQQLSGDPDARIADFFDLIAGTSTGGILACLYLTPGPNGQTPMYSAQQAVDLYLTHGGEVFATSVWHSLKAAGGWCDERYSDDGLNGLLERYSGALRLNDLLKPCLITAYDTVRRRAHFFKQHAAQMHSDRDFPVWAVARATSAAPTFFEAAHVKALDGTRFSLIDGGIFANNPALCAYAEARTMGDKPTASRMAILSIGTGEKLSSYPFRRIKNWGKIEWAVPVLDMMMSGVSETVDYQLRQIYDAVGKPDQYLRIQPELGNASPDMDNASRRNVIALEEAGRHAAETYRAELERFAGKLVESG